MMEIGINMFVSEHKNGEFFFGLATAPAHAEDDLNDAWIQFAKETPCSEADAVCSEAAEKKPPRKKVKLAVGAITKGLEKNTHGNEDKTAVDKPPTKNVAAWHNAPNP